MEVIRDIMPVPVFLRTIGAIILVSIAYSFTKPRPWPAYPLISVRGLSPKESWMLHGKEVLNEGFKRTRGPFQVMTNSGPKIILPSRYADEIRSMPELSFPRAFVFEFPMNYPGFEPVKQGLTHEFLVKDTLRIKLTQSLGLVTGDLIDETIASVDDIFGKGEDWVTTVIREDILGVVARTSSRIFLGRNLCRNQRWLEITKNYAMQAVMVANMMRMGPAIMRPLVYLVIPHSFRLRKSMRDARAMIVPELRKRKEAVDAARVAGVEPPKVANAIAWMYEVAGGDDLDLTANQMLLIVSAVDSPVQGLCRALIDLCKYPGTVQQLRDEIIDVVGKEGWARTTFYKLRLMDSFLKESQRVTPISLTSMNRFVNKEVTLSDGYTIPKGARLNVAADFDNPEAYPEPEKFDAARFVKKRQEPGQENGWQFVTTSATQLTFGHGENACPGRFFASNEMKAILCHLVMKYDWRFVPDKPEPVPQRFESLTAVEAKTQIQARRRKPELNMDSL